MARKELPKATRESILCEFNHRCAICGNIRPQIHHIDEDAENNQLENLIPLCPNCHLTDHHNPTSPVDNRKLSLFRTYKDPVILTSQFEPLFRRIIYLIELNEESFDSETIRIKTHELINFVAVLKMGEFYSMQIDILMQLPPRSHVSIDPTDEEDARWREEYRITHFQKVSNVRNEVLRLIIEMLRYQSWKFEHG